MKRDADKNALVCPRLRRLSDPTAERRCVLVTHEHAAEGHRLAFKQRLLGCW